MRANVGLKTAKYRDLFKPRDVLYRNNLVFIRGSKGFENCHLITGSESHLWYVDLYINEQFYMFTVLEADYRIWVNLRLAEPMDIFDTQGKVIGNLYYFEQQGYGVSEPRRITPRTNLDYLRMQLAKRALYVVSERQDYACASSPEKSSPQPPPKEGELLRQ